MIKLCSCFHRGSNSEGTGIVNTDRYHHSRMFGHPNCFNSQFPARTARSFKSLCFLTTSLAFCIGIGIGILIPLYLLPVRSNSIITKNNSLSGQFTPIVQSLIFHRMNTTSHSNDKIVISNVTPIHHQPLEVFSNRFPEFAHIQTLQEQNSMDKLNNPNPILRRPNSNVQFVATDSRILSLHPVQQEIPKAKFNISTNESVGVTSSNSGAKDLSENSDILNGIYWSSTIEQMLPKGFTDSNANDWRRFVNESIVVNIDEGCGRMQNRLLSLENGTQACCRYRQNSDQIQGEIFSFYLGQLLGLGNLAPSTLDLIQPLKRKWTGVRPQLNLAQWAEEKPVVLTRFIPNLFPAYIPIPFRDSRRSLHPIDILLSSNSIVESLDMKELAQWSDLIVFDYLTANLDRMVNNLYNLQWNPAMMDAPAHNLAKDVSSGLLVFLDNESGLLHGYRLLDKYEQYHRVMLDSLCVFRRSTADAINRLYRERNVGNLLKSLFIRLEPSLVDYLPTIPDKSIKILNNRIELVHQQILKCESLYMS